MLSELVPLDQCQGDLFAQTPMTAKSVKLMAAMDSINRSMGRRTVKLAAEGFRQPWRMKQGKRSPSYTTDWSVLISAS